MTMLWRLSAAIGLRTQDANQAAAERCLREPRLLEDVAAGLSGNSTSLAADCAEVMAKVAVTFPLLIVPYIGRLGSLLTHKASRVRSASAQAVALAASYAPHHVFPLIRTLTQLMREDGNSAVREFAIDALYRYGATDEKSARGVFPSLQNALAAWDGKHRVRILEGLARIAPVAPGLASEMLAIAEDHLSNGKAAVRSAADGLLKSLSK